MHRSPLLNRSTLQKNTSSLSSRPSPQPFQSTYLRFKSPSPIPIKSQLLNKRYLKIIHQSSLTPYHLSSLKDSLVKINNKTSHSKWRSPLQSKQRKGEFGERDRVVRGEGMFGREGVMFDGEVSQMNIGGEGSAVGYGENTKVKIPTVASKPNTAKLTNPRLISKTGLQKLTKQFHLLSKSSLPSTPTLAILPIQSPMFLSHFQKYYQSQLSTRQDQLLQKFKLTNSHYLTTLRHNPPQLIKRIFLSLTNYQQFDIYAFIRYHVIFVTREGNNTEKAYFLAGVFFEKGENGVEEKEFRKMVEMMCGGKENQDKAGRSVEGIVRLVLGEKQERKRDEGEIQREEIVTKNQVFRKLEMYDDVATVMISLLCKK